MEQFGPISEVSDVVVAVKPVDLQTGANNGAWVSMKECAGMNVILIKGVGTAGDDPEFSLAQAKDASGTGSKALTIRRLDYKVGTSGAAFTSTTDLWKRVSTIDRDNPASSYDTDGIDGAENQLVLSAYVLPQDLDHANGFSYIRGVVADVGANAQIGAMIYVPSGRVYQGSHNKSLLA